MIHRSIAFQLQALADDTRLKILKLVSSGSPSATDINTSLKMSQPRVAHHLKILVSSGLVDARRDGRFMRYTLPTTGFEAKLARVILESLSSSSLEAAAGAPAARNARPDVGVADHRPANDFVATAGTAPDSNAPSVTVEDEPERPAGIEDFLL